MGKNKLYANMATARFKDLIKALSDLEHVDRQRMSSSGKKYLDDIWQLLSQPTYTEIQESKKINKENLDKKYLEWIEREE
tara:strand:+ start:17387 stop:17626 length:240 start_codon:yes stop_codon:yes gene_type:complete